MLAEFNALRNFDFLNSVSYLWVYKDSTTALKFSAYFVPSDVELLDQLKAFAASEMGRITECSAYSYISQVNENSCLVLPWQLTAFPLLKDQVDRPEPDCIIPGLKKLIGSAGYVVKFVSNGETVYAVKRSSSTWKTAHSKKFLNVVFQNGELVTLEDKSFSIEKYFDFYAKGNMIYVANKKSFESAVHYTDAYAQAFFDLQTNPVFSNLFTDLQAVAAYVGSNSIQLRRMAVVEQKSLFAAPQFLPTLQQVSVNRGWGLNFDPATGKIVACEQTVKAIIQVLLDHRLLSEVTSIIYDVPDAVQV